MSKASKNKRKRDVLRAAAKSVRNGVIDRADGYLEGTYDPAETVRKQAVKGAAAVVLALSLLTGIAFSGPGEIVDDQAGNLISQPPIVLDIDDYANVVTDDDDDADEQKNVKQGIIARFKQAVFSLPSPVRILIVVPLWAVGTGLMTAVSFLWNVIFSSPLGAFIASAALGFAVLLGLFVVTAKMLFPDVPLRKILSKRNFIALGVVALLLAILDAALPLFWHDYPAVTALVKISAGAITVGVLSVKTRNIFRRDIKRSTAFSA